MPTNLRYRRLGGRVGQLAKATGGTPAAGTASPLLTSLVSYWKLDEASGTAVDAHSTNHLTDTNTVTSAAGKQGTARQFTVANFEYFTIPDNDQLSVGDIDFTLACWVYLDNLGGNRGFISKNTGYGGATIEFDLLYALTPQRLAFAISSTGVVGTYVQQNATSLGLPSVATWYFVVAWHDVTANTINIQVNNGPVDSTAHTLGVFNGSSPFTLGRVGGANEMDGRIDEAAMWKRVLTAGERTQLYNSGSGVTYPFS